MAFRDLSAVLVGIDGTTPLLNLDESKGGAPTKLTLQSVCIQALLGTYPDEDKLPGREKVTRYELARKIHDSALVDLKSEEVAKLKELIGKAYNVIVVGQAWELLEKEAPAPAKDISGG